MVTKSVKPYALVVGNPGKFGWVSEYGNRLNFNKQGKALCSESNQEYILEKDSVRKINIKCEFCLITCFRIYSPKTFKSDSGNK